MCCFFQHFRKKKTLRVAVLDTSNANHQNLCLLSLSGIPHPPDGAVRGVVQGIKVGDLLGSLETSIQRQTGSDIVYGDDIYHSLKLKLYD